MTRLRLLVLGAIAVAVVGALVVAAPRGGDPLPAVALTPDLPPLTADGAISDADLAHDSRDDRYRTPFGAVPAGTEVTLRLRAAAGDLTDATLRIYDGIAQSQLLIPMQRAARDAIGGEHGYDYWEATLHTTALPTILYYRFIARDGAETRYIEDDALLDGGAGTVAAESADASWQITTYDPAFATPDWAHGATVYQIFPDRFANGDPSNDPSPDAEPGTDGAQRYRYGDVYGNPVLPQAWDELPEGYCRAYTGGAACDEEPLGRDFYGGDLAGITEHLDELTDLGVTVLYLNPIFAAPSNHRYDTSDYFEIDPDLGTRADLDALLAAASDRGMHVILDGVFNHTSSDSPFFDRAKRYVEVGACESADSPYADWYTLSAGPPAKCFDGQTYTDWFGFDTLPALAETAGVYELVNGGDGVVRHWLDAGIGGWRLDVMNEISHKFLRALRVAAKEANPDALILGEEWNDASPWLLGTEADSVMNYRFRRAVIGLINGDTADSDGAIAGLTPSKFASVSEGVRENYPAPAWEVLHNLVDSHDTTRILWTLTPGEDDPAVKDAAGDEGKAKLRLLATLQLTWPGMAGIYYGDEVGLSGHDDPDDRRTYPWGGEDTDLRDHYRTLANLRADHESLRRGDLRFLLTDDATGTLAFGRRTDAEAAITLLNLSDAEQTLTVELDGYLPAGLELSDALSGVTTGSDNLTVTLPAHGSAVYLTAPGADLAAPAAPGGPVADATTGEVALRWDPVEDAQAYVVWRSVLAGGGYERVGETSETGFTDATVRNGVEYHYVVSAADAAGNVGPRSSEVVALPQVVIAEARLDAPDRIEQELSAVAPGTPIAALVRVDQYSAAPGATVGVAAQLGFGSGTPGDDWTWSPASFDADTDGADRFVGTLRPEEAGTWAVALRTSTDGGATWAYPGDPIELVAVAGSDTVAPAAPGEPRAASVSDTVVTLAWEAVADDDLYRYEVWRSDAAGGPYERVGTAVEGSFSDQDVSAGRTYHYVVSAQDTAFNRSDYSPEVVTAAESREVAVTFSVTVPETTPSVDTLYIAGDFQGWDPGGTPMQQVDDTTWSITLPFTEGQPPQYKYTRGSWEEVEKDAACAEIDNRTVTISFGTDGTQAVDDEVAKWRDVDNCDAG